MSDTVPCDEQPLYGPFMGAMGSTAAMAFAAVGAAYGTAKSGTGIASMAVQRPELVMRGLIPVIMAGIVSIYGLVVAVIIGGSLTDACSGYSVFNGFAGLSAGLVCGLCGVGAGYAIGISGDAGVRATALEPKFFVGMVLVLIFAEVLGLYGMIVALVLSGK